MTRHLSLIALAFVLVSLSGSPARAGSTNGSAGDMPAFYDGKVFTINFKELPPDAEKSAIAHNAAINKIFMSDPGLRGGNPLSRCSTRFRVTDSIRSGASSRSRSATDTRPAN